MKQQGKDVPDARPAFNFVVFLLIGIVTISFSTTGCGQRKQVGPPERVTVAYSTIPYTALFHIAHVKGFFSGVGLEVTLQPHELGKMAFKSFLEGKADLAISADSQVMFAAIGGESVFVVAVIGTSHKGNVILARKDRGISVARDLVGKRIGTPLGTTSHFFLDSFLRARGIRKEKVRLVNMGPDEMRQSLMTGKVDAVSILDPESVPLQRRLGDKGVVFYDEHIYRYSGCLTGHRDFVRDNPQIVRKLLTALLEAESFVKQHPEESRRLVAASIKTDEAVLAELWDTINFTVSLDHVLLASLEEQTRWAQKTGFAKNRTMPNFLDFIYVDGLRSVKPEAVTIIR